MVYPTFEEIEFAEFAAVIDDTKIYEHSISVIVDFVAFASSECAGLDVAVTPVLIDKDRKIRFLEDADGIDCSKMSRSLTDELLISALNVIILAHYGFGVSEKSVNHLIREEHFIRVTELTKDWEKLGERVPSSGFFCRNGGNPPVIPPFSMVKVSDLLCTSNSVLFSSTKEHDDIEDYEASTSQDYS